MWHGRRDGSDADPLDHFQSSTQVDDVGGEGVPSVVGFRTDEDQDIPLLETGSDAGSISGQVSSVKRPSMISSGGRRAR